MAWPFRCDRPRRGNRRRRGVRTRSRWRAPTIEISRTCRAQGSGTADIVGGEHAPARRRVGNQTEPAPMPDFVHRSSSTVASAPSSTTKVPWPTRAVGGGGQIAAPGRMVVSFSAPGCFDERQGFCAADPARRQHRVILDNGMYPTTIRRPQERDDPTRSVDGLRTRLRRLCPRLQRHGETVESPKTSSASSAASPRKPSIIHIN